MTNQSNIERIVMQRVHLIHALRFAVSSSVFSVLISGVALWGISRQVWVGHVLQNAPENPLSILQFYIAAFIHTRFVVQVLVILALVSLGYLIREVVRAITVIRAPELV